MIAQRRRSLAAPLVALLFAGCATVPPLNERLERVEPDGGYRLNLRATRPGNDPATLFILAFSGGGARAAAFSYGVLEELRRTEVATAQGKRRLLDEVDLITGVSGGSFTALSYALYGERLFAEYERRFLKRDVDGELVARVLSPANWLRFADPGFGRSEVAAAYYDEILFDGATYADLASRPTPIAIIGTTAISTGLRIAFVQGNFDVLCADLRSVRLSRAVSASSAVPVILSPVTLRNYGGSCGYVDPPWVAAALQPRDRAWPGNRADQRYRALQQLQNGQAHPYLHLVDGGIAGNLGLHSIVEVLQELEASPAYRAAAGIEHLRRIAIVVVNAHSSPDLGWDKTPIPPPDIALLLQAVSVPIDRFSYETIDALEDLIAEWTLRRQVQRDGGGAAANALPPIQFSVVDVSFDALADAAERKYLLNLPTTLSLPPEAVDRLRAAAGRVLRESPAFRKLVREIGAGESVR